MKTLNILHFTPRAYLGYLLFYKQNPHLTIAQHRVPHSVLELATLSSFRSIIDLRIALSLDNPLTLAKALPELFTHSLKPVNSFLFFLREGKVEDLEVEFYVEKAVESKLLSQ